MLGFEPSDTRAREQAAVSRGSSCILQNDGEDGEDLWAPEVMAIKGVTVSTKKITRVPGEARPPL